jgi:hypothetical protein
MMERRQGMGNFDKTNGLKPSLYQLCPQLGPRPLLAIDDPDDGFHEMGTKNN